MHLRPLNTDHARINGICSVLVIATGAIIHYIALITSE